MKTIETKGGQIFEIWESRKEALHYIEMMDINPEWWDDNDTLYIGYKDGSCFYIGGDGIAEGKFKKTGIASIIYSNCSTTAVYGEYTIYNIDDINETYTEENDEEEKIWNVE